MRSNENRERKLTASNAAPTTTALRATHPANDSACVPIEHALAWWWGTSVLLPGRAVKKPHEADCNPIKDRIKAECVGLYILFRTSVFLSLLMCMRL